MHWILQNNFFNERGWNELVRVLSRLSIPFSVHKIIPFTCSLDPAPSVLDDKVITMGSYAMGRVAKHNGWTPGFFDLSECGFDVQVEKWGEHMLNHDSVIVKFSDAVVNDGAFVRPIADSKVFGGRIISSEDMIQWQRKVCYLELDDGSGVKPDTMVQVASLKDIYYETRLWIINGSVVTASTYRRGGKIVQAPSIDRDIERWAESRAAEWDPSIAFVMDVCLTKDGFKIVEINSLNAAGFYAANMQMLVEAIETMRDNYSLYC